MTHMFHILRLRASALALRAWRAARTRRLVIAIALFAAATQLVLSQDTRAIQKGPRPTKMIGADRLVSVEPLPQMDGPMCDAEGGPVAESMMAALAMPRSL